MRETIDRQPKPPVTTYHIPPQVAGVRLVVVFGKLIECGNAPRTTHTMTTHTRRSGRQAHPRTSVLSFAVAFLHEGSDSAKTNRGLLLHPT